MFDPGQNRFIQGQPGYRSDRTGDPQESVGITQGQVLQKSRQPRRHRHPREVIVAKGWMARMTGDQYFFVGLTLDPKFTISQMSGMQTGIDVNVVFSLFQLIQLMLSQAETPVFLIVRSTIGGSSPELREW